MNNNYIIDESGCWLWQGAKDPKGYGMARHNGKVCRAYRVIYEELVGLIPEGLEIDHLCRVHACVNPEHLEPVTHRENILRGLQGRLKLLCNYGHDSWGTKKNRASGYLARYCLKCRRLRDAKSRAKAKENR